VRRFWKVIRWVAGISVVIAIVFGGAALFIGPKIAAAIAKQKLASMGPEVEVSPATRGALTRVVSAPGTVTAKVSVNISSRVSAEITRLPFEAGDLVRAGDVVVELDAKEYTARLDASKARLLSAEAQQKAAEANVFSEEAALIGVESAYRKAQADLERAQELFGTGDISRAELDNLESLLDQQKASYEARKVSLNGVKAQRDASTAMVAVSRADVTAAQEAVDYCIIRSPIDGVVTKVNSKVGEVALGTIQNMGSTILVIADLSEMLVRAGIAEVDVSKVSEGDAVKIYVNGYPDDTFDGVVRKLALENSVSMSDQTSSFEAEIVMDLGEEERMFAGLTANVDIEVETLADAVLVPSQAVVDIRVDELPQEVRGKSEVLEQGGTFTQAVYVLVDDEAKVRPVRVQASNLRWTAVDMGLDPEDKVIVGPYRAVLQLTDGKKVRVLKPEGEEPADAAGVAAEGEAEPAKAEGDASSDTGAAAASTNG
jgi:HlyD family secretion protein